MAAAYVASAVTDATIRALNYAPELDAFRQVPPRARARGWKQRRLDELVSDLGTSYAKVLTRVDCAAPHGDELLSQVDVFASEPSGRRIRGDLMAFVEELRIRRGDILIAGAGQIGESTLFGRAIIADGRLSGNLAAGDLMVLRFENADSNLALYVYAFLASTAGRNGIRAAAYGTSIPRMRPDLLAALPVALPDERTQARIADQVRSCMTHRETFARELSASRGILEQLPEMQQAEAMCGERKPRAVIWDGRLPTMVAWSYAAAGGALRFLRSRWSARIRDVLQPEGLFVGLRFARIPCQAPHGVDLLSQRDVFMIRRVPKRVRQPAFDPRRLLATPDQLLIACDGQFTEGSLFGRVEDARCGMVGKAVTQHMLRLVPEAPLKPWMLAFLTTRVGHRLLKSTAVGTSVPMMRHDLVADLPVPTPTSADLAKVAKHVESAIAARLAADAAENHAIEMVEREVLSAWLG